MLVLTRKMRESIRIGTSITLTVLSIEGSRVRLGIDAPRNIRVLREEVADAQRRPSRSANNK